MDSAQDSSATSEPLMHLIAKAEYEGQRREQDAAQRVHPEDQYGDQGETRVDEADERPHRDRCRDRLGCVSPVRSTDDDRKAQPIDRLTCEKGRTRSEPAAV